MRSKRRQSFRVVTQLKEKLGHNAVAMQIPIGLEADLEGVVDLVTMKAIYFDGDNGETIRVEEIPESPCWIGCEETGGADRRSSPVFR